MFKKSNKNPGKLKVRSNNLEKPNFGIQLPLKMQGEITIVRKSDPIIQKPSNGLKKLDVIIISVNYNDYLLVSLSHNIKIFNNITVVTSTDDLMCQKICEKFGVNCLVTDVMYENGANFNKGKAINKGIESIVDPNFILLLDADIVITDKIDIDELIDDNFYTSDRWICRDYNFYKRFIDDEIEISDIGKCENNKGLGFFQLFNINNNSIDKSKVFPEISDDAAWSDLMFRDKFTKRQTIKNDVIHLGDPYMNWNGRRTNRFLTDDDFISILNNIKKKVIYKDENLITLLSNIKYETDKIDLKFNIKDDNEKFIIHVSSIYKPKDDDSVRRNEFAQKTWKSLYESGNVIPAMVYDDNDLPKVKDIFEWGYKFCKNDDDIILYTNSDICITENAYNKILESCKRHQCTFSFRKDFNRIKEIKTNIEVSMSLFSDGSDKPKGADVFAVTKKWWEEWRNYLPDNQVIGRPTWDWVFRITMGKSIEGDIVFNQSFESQGSICETPNISYHESHNSYWNRPENILENISNTKIAYDWMTNKSISKNFTGRKYLEDIIRIS
jgi:hypothetical protein